jgi:hypothetical protein
MGSNTSSNNDQLEIVDRCIIDRAAFVNPTLESGRWPSRGTHVRPPKMDQVPTESAAREAISTRPVQHFNSCASRPLVRTIQIHLRRFRQLEEPRPAIFALRQAGSDRCGPAHIRRVVHVTIVSRQSDAFCQYGFWRRRDTGLLEQADCSRISLQFSAASAAQRIVTQFHRCEHVSAGNGKETPHGVVSKPVRQLGQPAAAVLEPHVLDVHVVRRIPGLKVGCRVSRIGRFRRAAPLPGPAKCCH